MQYIIPFRSLSLDDKELIQNFTLRSCCRNCDLNFMNLTSWQFLYDTEIALWNGWLIFRFRVNHHRAYMLPLGYGSLELVLNAIMEDAEAGEFPFLMLGICECFLPVLEELFPNMFQFSMDRDYSDYIYNRNDLENLAGKKLQPKRNYVNKFMRLYPDYEYRELTADLIPQCLALEQEWTNRRENLVHDENYAKELRSMRFVFDHWSQLDAIGGALFVENKLIAFAFGSAINKNTFDVCVEKANTDYEGAYAVVNRDFTRHLPSHFTLINREEDLGIEGLRKAKLSYQPAELLHKYAVMLKHPFRNGISE